MEQTCYGSTTYQRRTLIHLLAIFCCLPLITFATPLSPSCDSLRFNYQHPGNFSVSSRLCVDVCPPTKNSSAHKHFCCSNCQEYCSRCLHSSSTSPSSNSHLHLTKSSSTSAEISTNVATKEILERQLETFRQEKAEWQQKEIVYIAIISCLVFGLIFAIAASLVCYNLPTHKPTGSNSESRNDSETSDTRPEKQELLKRQQLDRKTPVENDATRHNSSLCALQPNNSLTNNNRTANQKRRMSDLADRVSQEMLRGKLKPDQFYFVCGGAPFDSEDDVKKTLEELHVTADAVLGTCLRAHGGIKVQLSSLPGYIDLTTEPCCLGGDSAPHKKRAKMPCGCAISVEMMKHYCITVRKDGNFRFFCPNCKKEWQFFLVYHVLSAALSGEDLTTFVENINKNFLRMCPGIQQCPFCHNNCERDLRKEFGNKNRVVCPLCSARRKCEMEFCWCCLNSWNGDMESCGNEGCDGRDVRLHHLETCATKQIGEVADVPSVRSCGRCGNLIYHSGGCKHMLCKCGYEFCFVCLKPMILETCQWQCGDPYEKCPVAPRQREMAEIPK